VTDTPSPDVPRRLEYMPLADLVARYNPANVKDHDAKGIAASVERFGFTTPIEVDERTGLLVAGHGRVDELASAKVTTDEVPEGILVRDGEWYAPVVRGWQSADDDEAQAYMVANNYLPQAGGWLPEVGAVLQGLADSVGGLPPGMTADGLDDLLASLGSPMPVQPTDAEHADDLSNRQDPATPRSVQGLHEVGLMFQADAHADYQNTMAQLRAAWGSELPTPLIVLRALHIAADQA
jgi:hypothetical protein